MSRRKPEARCNVCFMRHEHCLCSEIQQTKQSFQKVKTSFLLLMHYKEFRLPTNTGRLMNLIWPQSKIILRGQKDQEQNSLEQECLKNAYLLYPSEDSVVLDESFFKNKKDQIKFVVPDGNWRQASKVYKREALLKNLPRVSLQLNFKSEYKLRHEPKEHGLSTFEAMAEIVRLSEGQEAYLKCKSIFDLMVSRILRSRGKIV